MKWDDVYAADAAYRVAREEAAYRRVSAASDRRKQERAYKARSTRTVHRRKPVSAPAIALPKGLPLPAKGLVALAAIMAMLLYFLCSTALSFANGGNSLEFATEPADMAIVEETVNVAEEPEGSVTDTAGFDISETSELDTASASEKRDVFSYALPGELDDIMLAETSTDGIIAHVSDEAAAAVNAAAGTANAANDEDVDEGGNAGYEELLASRDWEGVTSETFAGLTTEQKVELVGQMAHDDAAESGVPASITAAQAILESGWMESSLTRDYENYFGIKASSEGFNWEGSTWTPGNGALMATQEEYEPGEITDIADTFRVYNSAWESIKDHSAYLANMPLSSGGKMYEGMTDQSKGIEEKLQILMDGGYATGSDYAGELMAVIESFELMRFDI